MLFSSMAVSSYQTWMLVLRLLDQHVFLSSATTSDASKQVWASDDIKGNVCKCFCPIVWEQHWLNKWCVWGGIFISQRFGNIANGKVSGNIFSLCLVILVVQKLHTSPLKKKSDVICKMLCRAALHMAQWVRILPKYAFCSLMKYYSTNYTGMFSEPVSLLSVSHVLLSCSTESPARHSCEVPCVVPVLCGGHVLHQYPVTLQLPPVARGKKQNHYR